MLYDISIFLLKSIAVSGILTGYYLLALRNKKQHTYNRFFLLFVLYASIQIPVLNLQWMRPAYAYAKIKFASLPVVTMDRVEIGGDKLMAAQHATNWAAILYIFCGLVSLVLVIVMLMRIARIVKIKRAFPYQRVGHYTLIETDLPSAPFSFLNDLFWRKDILQDSEIGRQVLQHELAHIKGKHTYDKLFSQLLISVSG